jgi:uncharacterized protein (DUF362 family)
VKYKYTKITLISSATLILGACGGAGGSGNSGPKMTMTEAQFAELKANCNLKTARFGPSTTTETSVVNGVTMTVEETKGTSGVMIKLSQAEGTSAFSCITDEFERMGAEAYVSME